jgi:hypothetical protein
VRGDTSAHTCGHSEGQLVVAARGGEVREAWCSVVWCGAGWGVPINGSEAASPFRAQGANRPHTLASLHLTSTQAPQPFWARAAKRGLAKEKPATAKSGASAGVMGPKPHAASGSAAGGKPAAIRSLAWWGARVAAGVGRGLGAWQGHWGAGSRWLRRRGSASFMG